MVVNMLMYGCVALVWYQDECDDLEIRQNCIGRWLWDVGNVINEHICGAFSRNGSNVAKHKDIQFCDFFCLC